MLRLTVTDRNIEIAHEIGDMAGAIRNAPYSYFRTAPAERRREYLLRYLGAKLTAGGCTAIQVNDDSGNRILGLLHDLPWDTEHFGRRCGKLEFFLAPAGRCRAAYPGELPDRLLSTILAVAADNGYSFLCMKCESDSFPLIHALEARGGRLVDCELTLTWNGKVPSADVNPRCRVEVLRRQRCPDPEGFAGIFSQSRFHADPMIPTERADSLWRKSILNAFKGYADEVVTLYEDAVPVAFAACRDDELTMELFPQKVRSLFLVGVLPGKQGMGMGRTLMHAVLEHSLDQTTLIEVETQSYNGAALALYQGSGFFVAASRCSFHLWL